MSPFRAAAPLLAALAAAAVPACAPPRGAGPAEVAVWAAVSLREPLLEIQPAWEGAAGARIVFSFGASSDLARQIVASRRADLFLSADEAQVDRLERAGLLAPGSRRPFLSNRLAVVVPAGSPWAPVSAGDLAGPRVKRLSIADPAGVPAGRYAAAWLASSGVWDLLADRIAPAPDARAALAAVESGAAEAGVVYRTDAALSRRARTAFEVPDGEGPRITYVAAALSGRQEEERSRAALDFLAGPEARRVFASYGFVLPAS